MGWFQYVRAYYLVIYGNEKCAGMKSCHSLHYPLFKPHILFQAMSYFYIFIEYFWPDSVRRKKRFEIRLVLFLVGVNAHSFWIANTLKSSYNLLSVALVAWFVLLKILCLLRTLSIIKLCWQTFFLWLAFFCHKRKKANCFELVTFSLTRLAFHVRISNKELIKIWKF